MIRDRLNRIFASKAFYIVFALLASVALWLFVDLNLYPSAPLTIDNVEVVLLNRDLLQDKNFVITEMSQETVSLTIVCKRSLHSQLNAYTVYVTVDLAQITTRGWDTLSYDIVFPEGIKASSLDSITKSVEKIGFTIDKLYEKTIPVKGEYTGGTSSEDLFAEPAEFSPDAITIYGPEEVVSRVARAWVPINRENLSRTTTEEALPFILLDANGEEISAEQVEKLTPSHETVRVTIPIKMIKEVALDIDLVEGAGANRQNTEVTIIPKTITVKGEPDALRDYNTHKLGTINLSEFDTQTTKAFPIVVPNTFEYSGEAEAIATISVIGLETRHFIVTNLQTVNTPKGMTPIVLTQALDVKIRGRAEDLDAITVDNISVVADLKDYKNEGGASVPVKITILGSASDIGPVGGEYRIDISLQKE